MSRHTVLTEVAAKKFYIMSSGLRDLLTDLKALKNEYRIPSHEPAGALVAAAIDEIERVLVAANVVRPGDNIPTESELASVIVDAPEPDPDPDDLLS